MKNKFLFSVLVFLFLVGFVYASDNDVSWIGYNINYSSVEDTPYFHLLINNITGTGENLTFSVDESGSNDVKWNGQVVSYNVISSWMNLSNSTNGNFTISAEYSNQTGFFSIPFKVSWINSSESRDYGKTTSFYFNITPINDPPLFNGLSNFSFNSTELFNETILVTDEENNIPYVLNISFLSCSVAQWSTRNCSNASERVLFNSSQYSFNSTSGVLNISFIPAKNDVGSYIINFSVMDNSSLGNQTTSKLVNFTVLNVNSYPYFNFICNGNRNATEDNEFTCWINVSDGDELNNLTITANYSWFTFNGSTNSITKPCNISTEYNSSFLVNFTATDVNVGNWSINFSLTDTGNPVRINSSIVWFFINNTEDIVNLNLINNYTIYDNFTFYINATDDDLLIPSESHWIKNENLTFESNNSFVSVSQFSTPSDVNYTIAKVDIDYDGLYTLSGDANYTIKINVTDTVGNYAERNFTIQVLGDTEASWNDSLSYVIEKSEGEEVYLNLSEYVNDSEGDTITFSYINDSSFPSFSLSSGIVNFTTIDVDVGYHNITFNASDGKRDSIKSFNFTINNVNDAPWIDNQTIDKTNATVSGLNVVCQEDNYTTLYINVYDDDFLIPDSQKSVFGNESLRINTTIEGVNTSLFNFTLADGFPLENKSIYNAIFTPIFSDVGNYNITVIVNDTNGTTNTLVFNLSVIAFNDYPIIDNISDYNSSINLSLYIDVNASDEEDGNESSGNLTYTISFLSGTDFVNSNESIFNTSSGVLNITFNSSQDGRYYVNLSVNDSFGKTSSSDFWIYVYGYPSILFPGIVAFNLTENVSSDIIFRTNHSVQNNLTYLFYINSSLVDSTSGYGNNTNFTWSFTPNFTQETYGEIVNLTLVVYPSNYSELNVSQNWNVTINHTNFPVYFNDTNIIGSYQSTYGTNITINLSNYFTDYDHFDSHYNQTVNFDVEIISGSSNFTSSLSGWVLSFSSTSALNSTIRINASDFNSSSSFLSNDLSNSFNIEFTTPTVTTVPTPTNGGGGGGSGTKTKLQYYSMRIIVPEDVLISDEDFIKIPFSIQNDGETDLVGINLSSIVLYDNLFSKNVSVSLEKGYVDKLSFGESKNFTMTIYANTGVSGKYKATLYANVTSPKFSDWADFYIELKRTNESEAEQILLFTNKLISENPVCLELTELVKEAEMLIKSGDYVGSAKKSQEAISACRNAISSNEQIEYPKNKTAEMFYYLAYATLVILLLGFVFYIYKRVRFNKAKVDNY